MDVTNPGLVSVADQVVGNPDTSVPALSTPREGDVLVPAADEGYPVGADVSLAADAADRVFPTPTNHGAGDRQYPGVSQSIGQVPGTAPSYAPFPAPHNEVVVGLQDVPQAGTSEFTVAGPRTSIQTNVNPESEREYAVTSVLDADTGGPVVEPAAIVSGPFVGIFSASGKLRVALATAKPSSLVVGTTVQLTASSPAYDVAGVVTRARNVSGSVQKVASAGGGTSVVVGTTWPVGNPGVSVGDPLVFYGTSVPAYEAAPHLITGVTDLTGTFTAVKNAGVGMISMISPAATGLSAGRLVRLSGAYAGVHEVVAVSEYSGSFQSVTDAGGGKITVHVASMPADVNNGQFVTLAGAVYTGTYQISNVTGNSFDCSPVGGYSATDAGTFASHTAVFITAFSSDYAGTWLCNNLDVAVAYVSDTTGSWRVSNFDVPGTYAGTAVGAFSYYPTDVLGTTRYRLGLAPADLDSFGVSLQDREVVFADPTLTSANSGASRLVQYAFPGAVVVGKYDQESDVPVLTTPQVGDRLTLYVQREGAEMFAEHLGQVSNQDLWTLPPPVAARPVQAGFPTQAPVNASTGAQPGQPVVGHGVEVPTAVNVDVASQSTTVGLPVDVFA